MKRSAEQLLDDARAIWRAAVAAVDSCRLVREHVRVEGRELIIDDLTFALDEIDRIAVVGGGKAGAGMAAGLVQALGENICREKHLTGWLNVPHDCVEPLPYIHLHGARPPGMNEPTAEGVAGVERILAIVRSLGPRDLCFCLLSGGGSALLPAPVPGVSLAEKLALTRFLSAAGANIEQLNTVRKQLSQIKGGRLAAQCRAGTLVTLIISDVLGDPLNIIASGPTAPDTTTPADALRVLDAFGALHVAPAAVAYLRAQSQSPSRPISVTCRVEHRIIGNNALAVDAAGMEAERRGYSHAMIAARRLEGPAEEVGRHLADMAFDMRRQPGPDCLITGGEPIVQLVPAAQRGKGGRNQQLVLAALERLRARSADPSRAADELVILSGGTDGEDGPTDAAGAWIDAAAARNAVQLGLDPQDYLRRNDAYSFFERLGTLIKTGPTHTNVCDVRVAVVARRQ